MLTRQRLAPDKSHLRALMIASCFVAGIPNAGSADLSPPEIMAASKAAMAKPMRYRVISGGNETVVYQKTLPDGSLASLSDVSTPFKKINIIYGSKSYELYLDRHVAIDTSFMYAAAKRQASSISASLGNKPAESSTLLNVVQRDGKDCFEIESALTQESLAAFLKALPPEARAMMPSKYRYTIEKQTYLMVQLDVLSATGSSLSHVVFKDLSPQPNMSDDLFMVPPGLEIKTPQTMREYTSLVVALASPGQLASPLIEFQPPPLVMTALVPPPPKLLAVVAMGRGALVGKSTDKSLSPLRNGRSLTLILLNVAALFVIVAALAIRRWRAK